MTKRDEAWSEIAGGGDWGQTWRDMKAGLRPTAIEGHLNQVAEGLVHAPAALLHAARHPVNALQGLWQQGAQQRANALHLLHQVYDPQLPAAQRQRAQDQLVGQLGPLMAGVIKEPGGNWLSGGVERALEPLHHRTPESFRSRYVNEHLKDPSDQELRAYATKHGYFPPHEQALNDWVNKKLGKYVKNDMGTERDPVRALAEQGILHVPPESLNFRVDTHGRYLAPGQRHVAQTDPAKAWEGAADLTIHPSTARQYQQIPGPESAVDQGWLGKLSPETPVYSPAEPASLHRDLGFNHLVDELHNAVRPDSDLPRELRLTPEQLGRTSVPDAVRLVHKINQHREKAKTEANLQLAKNPATHVLKEYPHTPGTQDKNPRGLHWVELKQPEDLPQGWVRRGGNVAGPGGDVAIEGSVNDPRRQFLEQALKYEGDQMGHCVGGYCPDVQEGRSRIFSLRDAKGQPHVTIETKPPMTVDEFNRHAQNRQLRAENAGEEFDPEDEELMQDLDATETGRHSIIQIKGKANRAPNPEYLPFVQDFVRTQGPWSEVGDLSNTGLVEATPRKLTVPKGVLGTVPKFEQLGIDPGYYTEPELLQHFKNAQQRLGMQTFYPPDE